VKRLPDKIVGVCQLWNKFPIDTFRFALVSLPETIMGF